MLAEDTNIPAVGAESNVESVAEQRNGPNDSFKRYICDHAAEDMLRNTERVRLI
jgi:K+-transporting ATPase c subunit